MPTSSEHRYVIAPGWHGSGAEHWQTHWERAWGNQAVRVQIESWEHPDLDDYLTSLDDAVGAAKHCTIVAHSLGTWAAAEWARTRQPSNVRLLLVAPPDPDAESFPRDEAPTFVLDARPIGVPALVVASTDDPYDTEPAARRIAAAWGAPIEVVGAHGHLNSASRLGMWPVGQALLARLEHMPL